MRFPKYLQKAGRHEEARQAYAQLFAEVDDRWEWRTGEHSRKIPFIEQERAALKAILLGLKSRGG